MPDRKRQLKPGDEVIMPAPFWVTYPETIKLAEGTMKVVQTDPKNEFKMTAAQLKAALTKKTAMVVLNSPNNPGGFTYTPTTNYYVSDTFTYQSNDGPTNLGTTAVTIQITPVAAATQVFSQNFDSVVTPALPAGWTTATSSGLVVWNTTSSGPDTPPNTAYTPEATRNAVNELVSPAIPLPVGSAQLT